ISSASSAARVPPKNENKTRVFKSVFIALFCQDVRAMKSRICYNEDGGLPSMTQRLLIILSLFSLPSSLLATTFLLTTPEQKIRQSDRVCDAQYLGQAEKKQPSGMCMTTAQFKKIECFKGNVPENFEVVWPGGICTHPQTKKITKTVVPGTPRFI